MFRKSPKRSTESKRESRYKHSQAHKRSTFIEEYIKTKYENIYEEANNFYCKLVAKYPVKRKLSTAPEYLIWEKEIKKAKTTGETTTERSNIFQAKTGETTTERSNIFQAKTGETATCVAPSLNIELMNKDAVQETRDIIMFQDIFPSITEEIDSGIIEQIVHEIENDFDLFNNDEMNPMIQNELNDDLNNIDPLEKELLQY